MAGYLDYLAELAAGPPRRKLPQWWKDLSLAERKQYVREHPTSKFKEHLNATLRRASAKSTKAPVKAKTKARTVTKPATKPAAKTPTKSTVKATPREFMREFKALAKDHVSPAQLRSAPRGFPGAVELTMITTAPEHRGQGHATKTMKDLTRLADKQGVPLVLNPNAIGKTGPNDAQLTRWYGKLGFKPSPNHEYYMVRKPRRAK